MPLNPADYQVLAKFVNETSGKMRVYLECLGDELVLSPGHEVELLARPSNGLLPLTINYVEGGVQIYAERDIDPDWHIKFRGKLYSAGRPSETRLAELE